MKPTTRMLTMLIAGTLAGVAPEISTPVKSAFAPGRVSTQSSTGASMIQLGWPSSTRALVLRSDVGTYSGFLPLRNTSQQDACFTLKAYVEAANGAQIPFTIEPSQLPDSRASRADRYIPRAPARVA